MTGSRVRWRNGSMAEVLQPPPACTDLPHQSSRLSNESMSSPQRINSTSDLPQNNTQCQQERKRTRGPARPPSDWGTDKKLIIELSSLNEPIGENREKLSTQLGVLARQSVFCPITYTSWTSVPEAYKNRIWEDVKKNCEVSDDYKKNCLKTVGRAWRRWKGVLRKDIYYKCNNDEERLAKRPDRVDEEDWKVFVEYTGSEMAKQRSETNRKNQEKKVMSHKTGRKSHAAVRYEMTKNGVEPDRVDLWLHTHTDINGVPVDQASADAIAAMKGMLDEVPESEQTKEFREKVFTDVFGPDNHGRTRTYGGLPPTEVFGKKSYSSGEHVIEKLRTEHDHEKEKMRMDFARELEQTRLEAEEKARNERNEFIARIERLERDQEKVVKYIGGMGETIPQSPDVQLVSDAESSHHQLEDPTNLSYPVGKVVQLLNYGLPKQVVAEGVIISKDPKKMVGGTELGHEFWEVLINRAIRPNAPLLLGRRNSTIGKFLTKCVPWRTTDIKQK